MTATTATKNLSSISTEDATAQVRTFLKEHGEIEMILPVVIGVFVTSRFQLRGANALLANLLVASLARQIFIHLKQEKLLTVNESNNSHSTVKEVEAPRSGSRWLRAPRSGSLRDRPCCTWSSSLKNAPVSD